MGENALKSRVRRSVYGVLNAAGLTGAWRRLNRGHLTCAVIHGIGAPALTDTWAPIRWRITPGALDRYLGVLAKRYTFVDVRTAADIVLGKRAVAYPLLVTIDDGYRNLVTEGLPIFRKHGVRPVAFVVTGNAATQEPFWFDRFDYALQKVVARGRTTGNEVLDGFVERTRGNLPRVSRAFINWTRQQYGDDRERRRYLADVVAELERAAGAALEARVDDRWSSLLTPSEIKEAAAHIDFGSHTVNHYRLGDVPDDVAEAELRESRAALESILGTECVSFCFPEGSFSPRARDLAADAGYTCAFTSDSGLNAVGSDPLVLRRIHLPPEESEGELLARMCGLNQTLAAVSGKRRPSRMRTKSLVTSLAGG